jgi:hypothetical protein
MNPTDTREEPRKNCAPHDTRCGDCATFSFCAGFISARASDLGCDWSPSRFRPSPRATTIAYLRGLGLAELWPFLAEVKIATGWGWYDDEGNTIDEDEDEDEDEDDRPTPDRGYLGDLSHHTIASIVSIWPPQPPPVRRWRAFFYSREDGASHPLGIFDRREDAIEAAEVALVEAGYLLSWRKVVAPLSGSASGTGADASGTCPKCGGVLVPVPAGSEDAGSATCGACGATWGPR